MTARVAACASMCVRRSRRSRRGTRRSTWNRRWSTMRPSASTGTTSCRSRRWIATCCRTIRPRARRHSSRCSSSQAPARAAAKPRTSSWSRNCSATACSWPTPPAARRSTAQICRPHLGRSTPRVVGRRGTTRSSRTTPNSVSACVSALMRNRLKRVSCWNRSRLNSAQTSWPTSSRRRRRPRRRFVPSVNAWRS